ncbi:MAG: ATP-binding protein [Myxococcales bacterium]|nr:ATP-binding protein [Myxococcales bacterium]
MARTFNTTGPCDPRFHYMVPPEQRLPEARQLAEQMGYFVVHAPRQTGKTTILRTLARALTAEGRFAALHFSCEAAKAADEDFGTAERIILTAIEIRAREDLDPDLRPPPREPADAGTQIWTSLVRWAEACPRPLVLVFDEIDALRGATLLSVLGQLRSGFDSRPDRFPWSVILCGLRDVRDYKLAAGGAEPRLGSSSPFNIKLESLRLGDFDRDEVRALLGQHTVETGQVVTDEAIGRVVELTAGQPWLVNALAREVTVKMGIAPPEPITVEHIDAAKERLILARQTHLDSLAARLAEPRVRRVIEPMLAGVLPEADPYDDDFQYVADLGLVARGLPLRIANPIYREVIVRVLASSAERAVLVEPRAFVRPDGTLDIEGLLHAFVAFWVEHGEVLSQRQNYHEVAPQLVLMAFLQRVVNGGGHVDREFGVGRGRIDLLIRWPLLAPDGTRAWQRTAFELKVRAAGAPDPLPKGLTQLDAYLDRLGLDTGILVLFDRRPDAPPIDARTGLEDATSPAGRCIRVLRG